MSTWAESMILWSVQSLLLVAAVRVAAGIARSDSAAQRHRLWLVAILAIVLLPVANAVVRALPVTAPYLAPQAYVAQMPVAFTVPAGTIGTGSYEGRPSTASASWRPLAYSTLFSLWATGVLLHAVRSCRSHRTSRRLRGAATRVEYGRLPVPIGYSSQVCSPILAGVLHPMILLPADISNWASEEQQRAVILHELAHLERRDHLVNLVQTFLGVLCFYHPAVRYALRQLVVERELACDERVLKSGARPAAYAEAILKVAERSIAQRERYQLAFSTSRDILDRRMTMILDHRPSGSRSRFVHIIKTAAVLSKIGRAHV